MKCTKHAYATILYREEMTGICPMCKLRGEHEKVLGENNILKGNIRPPAMQGAATDTNEGQKVILPKGA